MDVSSEETNRSPDGSPLREDSDIVDMPDVIAPAPGRPGAIPIPSGGHGLAFSTHNVIDYSSGLASPPRLQGSSVSGFSGFSGLRCPSLPTSPGMSSGLDLGSPMALNSPLSRSFGPVPIWAEDSVTLKASYVAQGNGRGVEGDNEHGQAGTRGLAGLGNLGNTCFMNSALQCLCHTPQLMYAFLSGEYKDDLNTDNPLGLGGKLASAFGSLLSKLWKPGASFVTPKHFKFMLSKFAPQFSGYSQQDSQELLSFLLDGLHEDLNRVKEKPYREEKDADGRPDEEVALEAWDNYRARNDSVVVDTFQGLYKSTLRCPACGYTSVKFDPFMYLSLPLPSPKRRTFQVTVVDQFGGSAAVLLAVRVPKSASVGDLIREVGKLYEQAAVREEVNEMLEAGTSAAGAEPSGPSGAPAPPKRVAEWALGQWNGKTMDLFLDEDVGVESIPEKPSFVYSYFSSKSYKLYAYRFPVAGRGPSLRGPSVPPSAGARPVLVYHRSSPTKDRGIPSLFFLPKDGCTAGLSVAKSEEDGHWEVQPDDSLRHALDLLAASSPINGTKEGRAVEDGTEHNAAEDEHEHPAGYGEDRPRPDRAAPGTAAVETGETIETGQFMVTNASPSPPSFRLLYGTSDGHPKSTSYFSSTPPSIGLEDPSTVFLCAKWTNDADRDLSVAREPVIEHESVMTLQSQDKLPFKATLADCLECFCQPEQLNEADTWYCSKCKDHVRAVKKLDLWHLPPVLVIHLKRFSYSRYSRDKLDTHIDFPLQQLDLSGFIPRSAHATSKKVKLSTAGGGASLKQEDPVYDLYAVSNHFGGMGGGHYTAFCQMPDDQGWYDFDDSHVSSVGSGKVQSSAAYVLFYHRRGSDGGLARKALAVADSVVHDNAPVACDSPRGAPMSTKILSTLEAIPSCEGLDMDL